MSEGPKTAAEKKAILNDGGKLADPEKDFWMAMPEAEKRLMAVLPTMVHEALAQLVEHHGMDMAPEVFHYLNVSASKAMMGLPNPHAFCHIVQQDAATFLKTTNADDGRQAALAVCYLILQLSEEGRIRKPEEAQAVLISTLIMEEAKKDGPTGLWRMDEQKVAHGAGQVRERLEAHGYLLAH